MPLDAVPQLLAEPVHQELEIGVLEGAHAPAAVADRVMVVVARGIGRLIARRAVHFDAMQQAQAGEDVEGAVDAGEPDAPLERIVEVLGAGEAAAAGEDVEHLLAGTAAAMPRAGELLAGVRLPGGRVHGTRMVVPLMRTAFSIIAARMALPRSILAGFTVAAVLAFAGCGDEQGATSGDGLTVAATTTQAADLVRQVAGERADTVGLLPPNADPHEYDLRPRDVKALADAGLVIRSGGDLDEWLADALDSAGADAGTVTLLDRVQQRRDGDEVDPHWWHDPRNAVRAVEAIRDALAKADPEGADAYARNAAAYTRQVQALDRAIAGCMGAIPPERRKLVTTHDALGYFADRYAIEVIGAVIPSLSTRGQPSAGETARLVRTMKRERVSAVFAEEGLDADVEAAIARETGARVGAPLYADTLGPPESAGASYLSSTAANARALADGFTGRRGACAVKG